jgi:uncharacterized protein (TIGR03435 family)
VKLAAAALSIGILTASLSTQSGNAQSTPATKPEFDVASVKQNKSSDPPFANMPLGPGAVYTPNGGFFSAKNLPLITYIAFAWKISGGDFQYLRPQLPEWVLSDRFDIQARAEGNPDKDTMRLMMRSLLADRFKLALRNENREIPVSAFVLITPGKTGPRLKPHTADTDCPRNNDPAAPPPTSIATVPGGFPAMCGGIFAMPAEASGHRRIAARDITMAFLARSLPTTETNRPLVDRTGLTDTVDFILEWAPVRNIPVAPGAEPEPETEPAGPTFQEALAKQLGIRLESQKAPMDVLVLDHIEHLSEN